MPSIIPCKFHGRFSLQNRINSVSDAPENIEVPVMDNELSTIKLDCEFTTEVEERRYVAWLYSPSVFGDIPSETILAYKISKRVKVNPTSTLRILRGVADQNPDWIEKIETFVASNSSVDFVNEVPNRLIVLTAT